MRSLFPSLALLLTTFISSSFAQQDLDAPSSLPPASIISPELACESVEACYRAVFTNPDGAVAPQDRLHIKIDRLRNAQLREPASIWAKRSTLLMGLLLIDADPAEAGSLLQSVQADFPHLDDYIRLWMGEAQAKLGDMAQAAALFESIIESPDSILLARASFRAGESWYRVGQCGKAVDHLTRGMALAPTDPYAPTAEFQVAECYMRDNRMADSQAAFRHLWTRYPNSPEAREASMRLSVIDGTGSWHPTSDELYNRALAFSALALHAETVEDLQKFLSLAPQHAKRDEAKFKLGTALVRLKRYDEARDVFRALADGPSAQAGEAGVWLGRVYLRQDTGDRLLNLLPSLPPKSLTPDQKAMILMLSGIWLDDQGQFDKAVLKYRQAANAAEGNSQRFEALWRIGWIQYREGQYQSAVESFQRIVAGVDDPQWTPQALYWVGRTRERLHDPDAGAAYAQVCRRYYFTYYCQLARSKLQMSTSTRGGNVATAAISSDTGDELRKDRHYVKAVELKLLGLDQEAAKELASLPERYAKDRAVIMELCGLLSDVGEYHQALRLTRLYFRESIERGGATLVPERLWAAAYPTAYLPLIRNYAGSVDPFLAAAIIREESQYEIRALSRAGAVGLMQVMPATAQSMAKKNGGGDIGRDDLFDYETNIRFGVKYLDHLIEQFAGNITQVVASYNAGPQAVSSWMAKYAGKDQDEFVEMIPYQETRQYVKRVLRSYREYLRLAGPSCEAGSLDKVC